MRGMLTILSALLASTLMPMVLLEPPKPREPKIIHLVIEDRKQEQQLVHLLHGDRVLELPMEDYLTGVVLAEMPASFAPEALKAQAVAARTFTCRQMTGGKHQNADLCSDSTCCQAWYGEAQLKERLGDNWQQYLEKARTAVRETRGQVLTYEGKYIEALYFSCSGGTTEDAVAVWGRDVPYLQSVSSTGEEESRKFSSQVKYSAEEFRKILQEENPKAVFSGDPSHWIGRLTPTKGGGVETIILGGQPFTGPRLRQLFHLNSAKFTVRADGDEITFSVLGAGHRVGMSQYGADAMARAGKTYEEILLHYYTGAEITKNP